MSGREVSSQGETRTTPSEDQTTMPKWHRQPAILISLLGTSIALLSLVNSLITSREQYITSTIEQIYGLLDQAATEAADGKDAQATLDVSHARWLIDKLGSRTPATVWLILGYLVDNQGHFDDAQKCYERAVRVADNSYDKILGLRCLGTLSFRLGKKEIGRQFYRDAICIHGDINLYNNVDNVDDAITYRIWSKSEESFGDRQKSDEYKDKAMKYLNKIGFKESLYIHDNTSGKQEQKPSGGSGHAGDPGAVLPQRP